MDKLERRLGPVSATAIVVANMIGAGIFTTSGIMADNLPSAAWVMLCWLFGGLIALSGALVYSELATRMPEAGGEYVYLKKLYHPSLGFLTGWTSLIVGFSAAIAASSMSFSEYFFAGLQDQISDLSALQLVLAKKSLAILIILTFTTIHFLGLRLGSRVQNFLTVLKIIIVSALALAGVVVGSGHLSNLSLRTEGSFEGMALGTAMVLVMFSYSGWNGSTYIAGEIKRPRKTLPVSLVLGTVIVILLYLLINLFIFETVPYSQLKGEIPVVGIASVRAFGDWMGDTLSLLVAVALLSSLSAFIMIGPRVYYAMAKDRLFFSFASKVHDRYKVPGRSVLIQGAIAVFMVIIGTIEQLYVYLGFALWIFPWLAVLGVFIARKKKIGEEDAAKTWGYPVVPLFFLISSLFLMIVAFANRPLESSAAILTILVGIPCYLLWAKSIIRAKKSTNGANP
jgi:APA family basic amino acid/polyamine antiporter